MKIDSTRGNEKRRDLTGCWATGGKRDARKLALEVAFEQRSRVRFVDTASRDPAQTLAAWFQTALASSLAEIRWQTGYFGADGIGLLLPILSTVRFAGVIGSNGGETPASEVHRLVAALRLPRIGARLGLVRYSNGLFHPKVYHLTRTDGTATAYVGSANMSERGMSGTNVEAGIILDAREDGPHELSKIAATVDAWFSGRPELVLVGSAGDVDTLTASGYLAPTRPPRIRLSQTGAGTTTNLPARGRVTSLPAVPPWTAPSTTTPASAPSAAPSPAPASVVKRWWKKLPASDAQRKISGNQRGAIALTQAGHNIVAQTFFRYDLFVSATWTRGITSTNQPLETAHVDFAVDFLGTNLGTLTIQLTHAPNREAQQANYTSELHLGPLQPHFARTNVTDKWLEIARRADGSFTLSILHAQP
jgi:hypothetical protein